MNCARRHRPQGGGSLARAKPGASCGLRGSLLVMLPVTTSVGWSTGIRDLSVELQIQQTLVMETRYFESSSASRPHTPMAKAMNATKSRRHGDAGGGSASRLYAS